MAQQMRDNAQATAASIAGRSTVMSATTCLQATTSQLTTLKADARSARFSLALLPESGVTKQGGPLSPRKSTLATSLGHHWLNDLARDHPEALVISTGQARRGLPHTPPDDLQVPITRLPPVASAPWMRTPSSVFALLPVSLCSAGSFNYNSDIHSIHPPLVE